MAIPVESWQAAGGELDVGDQVDVIDTGDSGPATCCRARRWWAGRPTIPAAAWAGRRTGASLWIAVEVSAAEALELASVIDADDFVMVRSTGATRAPSATCRPWTTPTPRRRLTHRTAGVGAAPTTGGG